MDHFKAINISQNTIKGITTTFLLGSKVRMTKKAVKIPVLSNSKRNKTLQSVGCIADNDS